MSLESSDIENVAWLARLAVDKNEIPGFQREIGTILALVGQMNAVDTLSIEPLAHPLEVKARLRADEVTETDQRRKFQEIAPEVESGHYLVPRVID